jgi:hypothetical protein
LALLPFGGGGLHTVHAQGRQFPKIDNPTPEQVCLPPHTHTRQASPLHHRFDSPGDVKVDEYHKWYCEALKDLYDRNKHRFGVTEELDMLM